MREYDDHLVPSTSHVFLHLIRAETRGQPRNPKLIESHLGSIGRLWSESSAEDAFISVNKSMQMWFTYLQIKQDVLSPFLF